MNQQKQPTPTESKPDSIYTKSDLEKLKKHREKIVKSNKIVKK